MGMGLGFDDNTLGYDLVEIGHFWADIRFRADFSSIGNWVFWKYVLMFLFVNSLESLLTVKAVDDLDPWQRTSPPNAELQALGFGNALSGILGGLPMISEVVRSGANVNFGAVTKWSNFFHGLFLLLAMGLLIPAIEHIPNTALAAMLIYAGYRLAAPHEFKKIYQIGKEQLLIFCITIAITLLEDLLVGVAAGMLVKLVVHMAHGVSLISLFRAQYTREEVGSTVYIYVKEAAIFTLIPLYKKAFQLKDQQSTLVIDFSQTQLIDHSFQVFLYRMQAALPEGAMQIKGLEKLQPLSDHPEATRRHED
jgi:MFS superfamily sulfate permease-like transporter